VWQVQLLSPEIDYIWRNANYEQIQRAAIWSTLEPPMTQEELGPSQVNILEFTPEQIALLERRIFEGSDKFGRQVSFRLDGPTEGGDNLLPGTVVTAHQPGGRPRTISQSWPAAIETPAGLLRGHYQHPYPGDIVTAVANSLRMTAEATRFGTATPLPPNWVTPVVVTATPTPENQATAQAMSEFATAVAFTTGEPPNMVTATPPMHCLPILPPLHRALCKRPRLRPFLRRSRHPPRIPPMRHRPPRRLLLSASPPAHLRYSILLTFDNPSHGPTDFEWRWTGAVPPGVGFEVRVWREGKYRLGYTMPCWIIYTAT